MTGRQRFEVPPGIKLSLAVAKNMHAAGSGGDLMGNLKVRLTALTLTGVLVSQLSPADDVVGTKEPFALTEQRNAAVGFALAGGLLATNAARNCGLLKDNVLPDAGKVESGWKQRNGAYIDASLGYLYYASSLINARKGKEAGQAFYKNAQTEIQQQAGLSLKNLFKSQPPDRENCGKLLGLISAGEMDLKKMDSMGKDNFIGTLDEILAFHKSVVERSKRR